MMSSKKKSKVSKLARMSEEDRMRYLQHKIAMEEEAQRRKHRLIATYLKNKAKHEEAFSRINTAKINQQWRDILRQIKCQELKDNAEAVKNKFELVLDYKNKMISILLSDFDASEMQYCTQFQHHIEIISKLIEMHQLRLSELHEWYAKNLETALTKVDEEKNAMLSELERDISSLREQHLGAVNECKKKLQQTTTQCLENEQLLSKKLLNHARELEKDFHCKLENIRKEYQNLFQQYQNKNKSKLVSYVKLLENDKTDALEIKQQNRLIRIYYEQINRLKSENTELVRKSNTEEESLKIRCNDLMLQFQRFSEQLENEKSFDKNQLKALSSFSSNVIKDMNNILQKGYRLQQMVKRCDNIEVKRDVVEQSADGFNVIMDLTLFPPPLQNKLENFWTKYNAIILQNGTLRKEKQSAETENDEMKRKIRRILKSTKRSRSVPRKHGF